MKEGAANVTYVHQDHLTGTSVVSNSAGGLVSSIAYAPFGSTRAGSVSTDIKFTGQRLDSTGLYFYNARYYDPMIGRFISADSIIPDFSNPQSLNRYSYVLNNPLKYTDPSGHMLFDINDAIATEEQGMPVAQEVWELVMALESIREVNHALVDEMENSDIFFNIQWGDLGEMQLGLTDPTNISSGTVDIILDRNNVNPDYWGASATAWALSHELVHGAGKTIANLPGSYWEEAVALQIQGLVGEALGFNPWYLPRNWNGNPIRAANELVHAALKVELSPERSKMQNKQLGLAFSNTRYEQTIKHLYPPLDFREALFMFLK